jgi:threonine aldolase
VGQDGPVSDPSLPPPPAASFASDNAAGVAPRVMDALVAANSGPALAYGDDPWTDTAIADLRDAFDAPVEVVMCWGGTGANVVGLASVLRPWEAVICTDSAHIVTDEAGAPARFTGSSLVPVPHVDGKLRPEAVEPYLHWRGEVHHPQPRVLSISQVTELGTVYTDDEVAALADLAHAHDLVLHLDGARIANALAATGSDLRRSIRDVGVDLMTFGLTKDGAMYGDAVVYLRPELATHAGLVRKQAGQLPSKGRFVAAQISALLADDLWLANARHANAMAARLAQGLEGVAGVRLAWPCEANEVFPILPRAVDEALQGAGFLYRAWSDLSLAQGERIGAGERLVRLVTSWATEEATAERFLATARDAAQQRAAE